MGLTRWPAKGAAEPQALKGPRAKRSGAPGARRNFAPAVGRSRGMPERAGENSSARRVSAANAGHRKTPMQPGRSLDRRAMMKRMRSRFLKPRGVKPKVRQDVASSASNAHGDSQGARTPRPLRTEKGVDLRRSRLRLRRIWAQGDPKRRAGRDQAGPQQPTGSRRSAPLRSRPTSPKCAVRRPRPRGEIRATGLTGSHDTEALRA